MSYVPVTPTRRNSRDRDGDRDRRRVQSTTPTKRSGVSRNRLDRLAVSPGGSSANRSLLLPRISTSSTAMPPRPVTPSSESWEVSKDRPASMMNIIDRMPSTPPRRSYSSNRSVVSESAALPFEEDEMPDDEKLGSFHRRNPKRFGGLEQPVLNDRFDEKPPHNSRAETQHLKREVTRLTSLLNRAHDHDSRHDRTSGNAEHNSLVHNVDAADQGGGAGIHQHLAGQIHDDDVSSLGGVEDYGVSGSSLNRLSLVLRSRLDPSELSPEEKAFWDKLQLQMAHMRIESRNKIRSLQNDLRVASDKKQEAQDEKEDLENKLFVLKRDLQTTKAKLHVHGEEVRGIEAQEATMEKLRKLEEKHKEVCTQLEEQQVEHERAIRAIQRVLADVTNQRDALAEKLQGEIDELEKQNSDLKKQNEVVSLPTDVPASANDVATLRSRAQRAFALEREMEELKTSLSTCEATRDELKQELEQKGGKIAILEQEVNLAKASLASSRKREDELCQTVAKTSTEVKELGKRIETIPSRGYKSASGKTGSKSSQAELETLREELLEKRSSLETAKNIIASLENASGSLTTDLRGKLKDKEEQITTLKTEMASGKRTLDNLATELRDLQLQKKQLGEMKKQAGLTSVQQRQLQKELQKSLSELRSVTAVHEAGGCVDEAIVDQISTVLGSLMSSLEASISGTRALATSSFDKDSQVINDRDAIEGIDVSELSDEAKVRLSNLEDALRAKTTELEQLTNENNKKRLGWEEEEAKMKAEIRSLQDQCMTNMQVLTKKERELEVLRDSLEVSEGMGYISDDGTDAEEEEEDVGSLVINRTMSIDSSHYSCSQAEAVATLLVQGGTGIEVTSGVSSGKFDSLRKELKKANAEKDKAASDLRQEQEALANAKMIISSLERANKTMLEDLRSRLQDSNTAIASLLEKSSEQEMKSSTLQSELEKLKEEKDRDAEAYERETQKLKDEQAMVTSKLAAKEREVQDLLERLQKGEASAAETASIEGGSAQGTREESSEELKEESNKESKDKEDSGT